MNILVKNCKLCPFIVATTFGEGAIITYFECGQGAFGASEELPNEVDVHECCPLRKESINVVLIANR